jgi:hypothetical protein
MRVLMKVRFDVEAGNQAIRDGRLGGLMERSMRELQPEAAYFGTEDGKRTGWLVFDLAQPSDIVPAAEPFFMELDASVDVIPVMTPDDVGAGVTRYREAAGQA